MHYIKLILLSFLVISCANNKNLESAINKPEEAAIIKSKRIPPKHVEPVIIGDIMYSKHLNEIIATNTITNTIIWQKIIYHIEYDKQLERDVQDVHIDELLLINNALLIRNEMKEYYLLNISTKNIKPYLGETKAVFQDEFSFIISQSSKDEFVNQDKSIKLTLLSEKQCIQNEKVKILSDQEVNLKLSTGKFFRLKKETFDEQFHGYTFIHLNKELNIYILWENWLEAGHPIMVDGTTGKQSDIIGKSFRSNGKQTLLANFGKDIGAGWTPNGVQIFKTQKNKLEKLFVFDPREALNEIWGPSDLKWQDDSTLLIEAVMNDGKGGYLTTYKKLEFYKR